MLRVVPVRTAAPASPRRHDDVVMVGLTERDVAAMPQ